MKPVVSLASALLLMLSNQVFAQSPAVVVASLSPARNTVVASPSVPLVLPFTQPINPSTAFRIQVVSSRYLGRRTKATSTNGSAVTLTPTAPTGASVAFRPGELLTVIVPSSVLSTSNVAATPSIYQFTAATVGGSANFVPSASVEAEVGNQPKEVVLADLDGDGDLDFATSNLLDNTISLRLNDGVGTFLGRSDLAVGAGLLGVCFGDMDANGTLDLLVANGGSNGTVEVRSNNGAGVFTLRTTVSVGSNPEAVAVADVNGDGNLDILTANRGSNTVSIRIGTGTGLFTVPASNAEVAVGAMPENLTLGDIDHDGDLDLLVANTASNSISVRINNGLGAFGLPTGAEVSLGVAPTSVVLGDVDGDGDLDLLATGSGATGGTLKLGLNNGAGGFGSLIATAVGGQPKGAALGDVDSDGDLDLVLANAGAASASVLLNNGTGAFTAPLLNPAPGLGLTAGNLAVGDLDGDGDLDLLAVGPTSRTVSVRLNGVPMAVTGLNPARNARAVAQNAPVAVTFSLAVGLASTGNIKVFSAQYRGRRTMAPTVSGNAVSLLPTAPAGRPTAFKPGETVQVTVPITVRSTAGVTSSPQVYQFTIAPTGGTGSFSAVNSAPLMANPNDLALGDMDDDGDLDIVSVGSNALVCLNDGTGTFSPSRNFARGNYPSKVKIGDFNGDGKLDIVVSNYDDRVTVQLNAGGGFYSPPTNTTNLAVGTAPEGMALGDVDADGDLDLCVANTGSGNVSVRLNNGDATFELAPDVAVGQNPSGVALGDVDGDGDLDLLTANAGTGTVSVRFNNGHGLFLGTTSILVGRNPQGLALADVDGDGDVDIATANRFDDTASILLNNGAGVFTVAATLNLGVGNFPVNPVFGDVDGDGNLDLLVAYENGKTVGLVRSTGQGNFAGYVALTFSTGVGASIALGDVDGDGDLDFAMANRLNPNTTMWLNSGVLAANFATGLAGAELYPNPAPQTSAVYLDVPAPTGQGTSAEVLNVLGQVVVPASYLRISNGRAQGRLFTNDLAAGVYMVCLRSGGSKHYMRFVLE